MFLQKVWRTNSLYAPSFSVLNPSDGEVSKVSRRTGCIQRLLFVLVVLLACGASKAMAAAPCGKAELHASAHVRGFIFKSYEPLNAGELACMIVYRQRHEIYRMTSHEVMSYDFGQPGDAQNKISRIEDGKDLTGQGHPDMIVASWSGGAHCCTKRYVLELEPRLRVVAKVEDRDSDLGHFERLSDGSYEYLSWDIWSYWPQSFASSVSHEVRLRWVGDALRLDVERMKKQAPTQQEWQSDLDAVGQTVKDGGVSGEFAAPLWDKVLDFIYSGRSELAWKFVREVNPDSMKYPNPSLGDFCSEMVKSRYWPELNPTLREVPRECSAELKEPKVAKGR
jgi:hypothetical protein